jgi:hypothetical protein
MVKSSTPALLRWSEFDEAVQELEASSIRPLFVIFAAPPSAAGECEPHPPSTCGIAAGHGAEYVEFVAELMERYPQALVQVWNEPDIGQYGGMPARRVAALTEAVAGRFPGRVVGAAASPANPKALRYTRRAYRGVPRSVPMAVHFYPRSPVNADGYRKSWRKARKIAGKRALWVTEVGYASSSYGHDGQAKALRRTYRFLARHRAAAVIVHRLRDAPTHDSAWLSSMGMLNVDGSPKPAYEALRQVASKRR